MQTRECTRIISYRDAIREALRSCMAEDPRVIVVGEGVPDPKAIFETTRGLREEFGANRVWDMPLSENGLTGVLIGAALQGLRPVMVHQRIDFMMLAMDQIVNNAAKWRFMFAGQAQVPIVFRALIGRGWGQGPQHSQSFHAMFGHVPGLKVVLPATAHDAKGMMIAGIRDNNPVIFLEHRWLHLYEDEVPEEVYEVPLDRARVIRKGKDITVAGFSHMVVEALKCAKALSQEGIELEVIDLRSANPLDLPTVLESVRRTGHLAVLDIAWKTCGISAEIIAQVVEKSLADLKRPPVRISMPDHYVPTAFATANACYPEASDVALAVLKLLAPNDTSLQQRVSQKLKRSGPLDVPTLDFKGPF